MSFFSFFLTLFLRVAMDTTRYYGERHEHHSDAVSKQMHWSQFLVIFTYNGKQEEIPYDYRWRLKVNATE